MEVLYSNCAFCPDPLTNMATTGNSCFWLVDLNKSSPLKPLGQMIRKLVGRIYGRSSIKITHFVPINKQIWLPQASLVSYWSISKTAFPLKPLGQMIWNLVRSIYGRSSIEITYLALIHLQTWLPQVIPKYLLIWNCFAKMNRYLVGSTYRRFCIFPHSRMKGEWHRLSPLSL